MVSIAAMTGRRKSGRYILSCVSGLMKGASNLLGNKNKFRGTGRVVKLSVVVCRLQRAEVWREEL